MSHFVRRFRGRALVAGTAFALMAGLFAGLGPQASFASSHREAPLTSADPQIDGTDLYAFRSPDRPGTVTLISNWIPFEEPAGGPNFYSWAAGVRYDINIDNNGDAVPDVIYRWVFQNHYRSNSTFLYNTGQVTSLNDPNLNFYQTYKLIEIDNGTKKVQIRNGISAPSDVGVGSMPNYERDLYEPAANFSFENGQARSFAGQADDPFFLDLRIFDLLYGGNLSEVGDDTLQGFNVNSLALRVPIDDVQQAGSDNPVIGIWTTAERRTARVQDSQGSQSLHGPFVQVSRLGNPLVNEVVIPVGQKDKFNASDPTNDGQFLPFVQDPEVPHVVNALYGLPIPDTDPNTPGVQRSDLISVFLTGLSGLNQIPNGVPSEMLRLNLSTPVCNPGSCSSYSRLGVIGGDNQGFPNGRRLGDDVVDIALRVVEGQLAGHPNSLSDGVNTDSRGFEGTFPYVEEPVHGSETSPH
jgi:hypothetical protein